MNASTTNRPLAQRISIRFLDLMALAGLAFLMVVHLQFREPRPGASRDAYDTYMREFVLEHNLTDMRKQAIEARREFRNAEWENTRRTHITLWIMGAIFLYGFWRLLIFRY